MIKLNDALTSLNQKHTEVTMCCAYFLSFAFLLCAIATRQDMLLSVLSLHAGIASSIIAIMSSHQLVTREFETKSIKSRTPKTMYGEALFSELEHS